MRYVPALDGYRGLAILLVILFHAQWLPMGWIGVTLFFILSSYLITSILVEKKETSASVFFGDFWKHRALRLLPLYFGYLLIIGCLIPPGVVEGIGLATFTFNLIPLFRMGEPSHQYGHFWSLSVEAQFYLIWPALIWSLHPRSLRRLAATMILIAPAARYMGMHALSFLPERGDLPLSEMPFFLLPTSHLDAFGWGALLALPRERDRGLLWTGIASALVTLSIAFIAPRQVWTFSVVSAAGAFLLAIALKASFGTSSAWWRAPFLKIFASKPLAYVGLISYGLYVWHYTLTEWIERWWPAPLYSVEAGGRLVAILAASFGVATVSYFALEKRFLRRKRPAPAPAIQAAPVEIRQN